MSTPITDRPDEPAASGPVPPAAPSAPPHGPAEPPAAVHGLWPRLHRALVDALFVLLLLGILLAAGWLAARHDTYFDWTLAGRNSLSPESIALLERLPTGGGRQLAITVFAPRDHTVGRAAEQLVARYRRHRPDLDIQWIDPHQAPERARDADVELLGQVLLEFDGRRETLSVLSESTFSGAIARLTLERTPWVAVLEGHGERALEGAAGPDIGRFGQLLRQRGFRLQPLDLARTGQVPDNTDLLLVSMPGIALFPGEVEALVAFVEDGGNLLWLMDPTSGAAPTDGLMGLEPLTACLGVRPLPGMVVDATASDQGYESPTFAVLKDWPEHSLGRDLERPAVLPGSRAFEVTAAPGWLMDATLTTGRDAWNETGPIRGEVSRDAASGEEPGPLPLAILLTRPHPQQASAPTGFGADGAPKPEKDQQEHQQEDQQADQDREIAQQRVIIVGDGDFLSNAHLASAENQTLALRMARWLVGQEDLIAAPDGVDDRDNFALSPVRGWAIAVGAPFAVPALLLGIGLSVIWQRGRA